MQQSTFLQPGLRRALDVAGSLALLIVFAPVLTATSLALLAEGGPVLLVRPTYCAGRRVGVLEFRTRTSGGGMSRLGEFLWRTRVNQLPVLLNILRGEISFEDPVLSLLDVE